MGCDIHLYKEKFVDGKWVTADNWVQDEYETDYVRMGVPYEERFTDRNYQLFGLLVDEVRSSHQFSLKGRGMPFDACEEVAKECEYWSVDGHSHSYLYLHELESLLEFTRKKVIKVTGMKDEEELKALRASIETGKPDWDLLWPYCGWTSSPGYVEFEQEIPASLYFEGSLKKIIKSFDGVDGENHRIVFWFDN